MVVECSKDKSKAVLFDYEGVRRCVHHLSYKLKLSVVGVVFENQKAIDNNGAVITQVPEDIAAMCRNIEEAPRIADPKHKSADDEMTIKCAHMRNCRILDGDNCRDWKKSLLGTDIGVWLVKCQQVVQMRYFFDSEFGVFSMLEGDVPATATTASNTLRPSGRGLANETPAPYGCSRAGV